MQDGKIEIGPDDITTNLPYVATAGLVLDHHDSEAERNEAIADNHVLVTDAPSAARVVWKHYGGEATFPRAWDGMMAAVDKADAAQFSLDEVLEPDGWELLNLLMDSRTGLGRFRAFRISNYALMMQLIDECREHPIEDLLALPDVAERIELYRAHADRFREQLLRCATVHGHLVVLDLQDEEVIHPGSRFAIYALFPACNISIHRLWGFRQQNTVFATGKSIFDRSSTTNVGELMLGYGGGGHQAAGTCQVDNDRADQVLDELIERIDADERARLALAA